MRYSSGILLTTLLFSTIALIFWSIELFDTTLLWLAVLVITAIAFLADKKGTDLFHPGVGFPIVYSFLYGMGFLYLWINDDPYATDILVYSVIGIISYQFGVNLIAGRMTLRADFFKRDVSLTLVNVMLIFIASISVLSAAYVYKTIGVPILADDIYSVRDMGYKEVSHYSLYLLRNIGLVFNVAFLVSCASTPLISFRLKFLLTILFTVAFLLLLSTASRADLMFLFILFAINYHYVVKRISLQRSVLISVVFILLAIGYNYYRMFQYSGVHETIIFLSNKFEGSQIYMFLYHILAQVSLLGVTFRDVVATIPESMPYFYGAVIPITLSTYLPGHQAPPGELLKEHGGILFTGGQANLTLLGDFYSDFGVTGIVIGMFLLGASVSFVYRRLCETRKISLLIIYTYIVYSLIVGLPGGLFSQAIRYYYLVIILIIIYVSGYMLKSKKNRSKLFH